MPRTNVAQQNAGLGRRIKGREFQEIRKRSGYRAGELADVLRKQRAPITTKRSVYLLETQRFVPTRYVDALRALVGAVNFDCILQELDKQREEREKAWR